jgi:hypothetical protein
MNRVHRRRTSDRKAATTPLAKGPFDGKTIWLASVHARRARRVRNVEADPEVRIKFGGSWHSGRATAEDYDEATARRFNFYARSGPKTRALIRSWSGSTCGHS